MKLLKLLLLSALLAAAPLNFTACKAPHTAQQLAIKSLDTTWQSVHAARLLYASYYKAGKVNADNHRIALAADANFRACFEEALVAASQDWSTVTPNKVAVAADSFIKIVSSIVNPK